MSSRLFVVKSHVKGHLRDGKWVTDYDNTRQKKPEIMALFQAKKPQHVNAPQYGFGSMYGGHFTQKPKLEPKAFHPRESSEGLPVGIYHPSEASGPDTWHDPVAIATFTPDGVVPDELNGVPFVSWSDHPTSDEEWADVHGQIELDEDEYIPDAKIGISSGVVIEEPDGRVWVINPTNSFGGYKGTFPKGGVEDGLSMQANAIKEAFEETGLQVEITDFIGDFDRSTSRCRFYRARRIGGTPSDMGWESQSVQLIPKEQLYSHLNRGLYDHPIAHAIGAGEIPKSAYNHNPTGSLFG